VERKRGERRKKGKKKRNKRGKTLICQGRSLRPARGFAKISPRGDRIAEFPPGENTHPRPTPPVFPEQTREPKPGCTRLAIRQAGPLYTGARGRLAVVARKSPRGKSHPGRQEEVFSRGGTTHPSAGICNIVQTTWPRAATGQGKNWPAVTGGAPLPPPARMLRSKAQTTTGNQDPGVRPGTNGERFV